MCRDQIRAMIQSHFPVANSLVDTTPSTLPPAQVEEDVAITGHLKMEMIMKAVEKCFLLRFYCISTFPRKILSRSITPVESLLISIQSSQQSLQQPSATVLFMPIRFELKELFN